VKVVTGVPVRIDFDHVWQDFNAEGLLKPGCLLNPMEGSMRRLIWEFRKDIWQPKGNPWIICGCGFARGVYGGARYQHR